MLLHRRTALVLDACSMVRDHRESLFHLRWERVDVVLNDFTLVVQTVCTQIHIHNTFDY
jgi:hypothetical protein